MDKGFFTFKYEKNEVDHKTGLDDLSNMYLSVTYGFVIFTKTIVITLPTHVMEN